LSIRSFTKGGFMLAAKKTATNIGVGVGIGLEVVGILLVLSGRPALTLLAVPIMLASVVFFAWGCWSYAAGKGYPGVLGLLGVFFGILGLVILLLLPDKCKDGRLPTSLTAAAYPMPLNPTQPTTPSYGYGSYPPPPSPAFVGGGSGAFAGASEAMGHGAAVYGLPGNGNGNGGRAAKRPPMGGDGAAGWDEGASIFSVPQSVLGPPSVVPDAPVTAVSGGDPQCAKQADSSPSRPPDQGDYSPPMRPRTPPVNHWSVRQPA